MRVGLTMMLDLNYQSTGCQHLKGLKEKQLDVINMYGWNNEQEFCDVINTTPLTRTMDSNSSHLQ